MLSFLSLFDPSTWQFSILKDSEPDNFTVRHGETWQAKTSGFFSLVNFEILGYLSSITCLIFL